MSTATIEVNPANARFCSLLLDRWSAASDADWRGSEPVAEHLRLVRCRLESALMGYQPWMDAADRDLLERMLTAPHADALGDLYFRCFDLMERKLGMAQAVLHMHDIFYLLRPHIAR